MNHETHEIREKNSVWDWSGLGLFAEFGSGAEVVEIGGISKGPVPAAAGRFLENPVVLAVIPKKESFTKVR